MLNEVEVGRHSRRKSNFYKICRKSMCDNARAQMKRKSETNNIRLLLCVKRARYADGNESKSPLQCENRYRTAAAGGRFIWAQRSWMAACHASQCAGLWHTSNLRRFARGWPEGRQPVCREINALLSIE